MVKKYKKRKNPENQDKVLDEIEYTLNRYGNLFKHIAFTNNWRKCYRIIIYYYTFLYYLMIETRDIVYDVLGIETKKGSFVYGDYIYEQYILINFDIPENFKYNLDQLRDKNLSQEMIAELIKIKDLLKMNYIEFFKDIQSCKKLPEPNYEIENKSYILEKLYSTKPPIAPSEEFIKFVLETLKNQNFQNKIKESIKKFEKKKKYK